MLKGPSTGLGMLETGDILSDKADQICTDIDRSCSGYLMGHSLVLKTLGCIVASSKSIYD